MEFPYLSPLIHCRLSDRDFVLSDSHTERPIGLRLKVKNIDQEAIRWTLIDLFAFVYEGHGDKPGLLSTF